MSECHFRYVFPGITFLGLTYPFFLGGGGGVPSKCLKNFTDPVSFLRSLGPLDNVASNCGTYVEKLINKVVVNDYLSLSYRQIYIL